MEHGRTAQAIVLEGQKIALEQALSGAPIERVLTELVRTIEAQSENEVLGSILLVNG